MTEIDIHEESIEKTDGLPEEEIIPTTKFLVFSCSGSQKYAVYAENAEEVLTDIKIYQIPFAPSFVMGTVNQHGNANIVISLENILNNNTHEILKEDNICLAIKGNEKAQGFCINVSRIVDFYNIKDEEIIELEEENNTFFEKKFILNEDAVFILKKDVLIDFLLNGCRCEG